MPILAGLVPKRPTRSYPVRNKTKRRIKRRHAVTAASAAVLTVTAASTALVSADDNNRGNSNSNGRYVTGDFHNHTTCSDGTLSLQKLVDKSTRTFGLDWFVQS